MNGRREGSLEKSRWHLSCNQDARKYSRGYRNETYARFSGMGCVQEAALRLLHASRGTPRSRTLPIPELPPTGKRRGLIVALYLVNRRGSPITPLTGHQVTSFQKRGQRELLKLEQPRPELAREPRCCRDKKTTPPAILLGDKSTYKYRLNRYFFQPSPIFCFY